MMDLVLIMGGAFATIGGLMLLAYSMDETVSLGKGYILMFFSWVLMLSGIAGIALIGNL